MAVLSVGFRLTDIPPRYGSLRLKSRMRKVRIASALVQNARTFNRRIVQWWFKDRDALDQDNTSIWQASDKPKPLSQLYMGWQEMLAEHRQIIVQVQEIVAEMAWRGPEERAGLQWARQS